MGKAIKHLQAAAEPSVVRQRASRTRSRERSSSPREPKYAAARKQGSKSRRRSSSRGRRSLTRSRSPKRRGGSSRGSRRPASRSPRRRRRSGSGSRSHPGRSPSGRRRSSSRSRSRQRWRSPPRRRSPSSWRSSSSSREYPWYENADDDLLQFEDFLDKPEMLGGLRSGVLHRDFWRQDQPPLHFSPGMTSEEFRAMRTPPPTPRRSPRRSPPDARGTYSGPKQGGASGATFRPPSMSGILSRLAELEREVRASGRPTFAPPARGSYRRAGPPATKTKSDPKRGKKGEMFHLKRLDDEGERGNFYGPRAEPQKARLTGILKTDSSPRRRKRKMSTPKAPRRGLKKRSQERLSYTMNLPSAPPSILNKAFTRKDPFRPVRSAAPPSILNKRFVQKPKAARHIRQLPFAQPGELDRRFVSSQQAPPPRGAGAVPKRKPTKALLKVSAKVPHDRPTPLAGILKPGRVGEGAGSYDLGPSHFVWHMRNASVAVLEAQDEAGHTAPVLVVSPPAGSLTAEPTIVASIPGDVLTRDKETLVQKTVADKMGHQSPWVNGSILTE